MIVVYQNLSHLSQPTGQCRQTDAKRPVHLSNT